MIAPTDKVVLDCVVYAQALINPRGPAGRCIELARQGRFWLIASTYVHGEIRELPSKIRASLGVSAERIERLIAEVASCSVVVENVPAVYAHPVDPDDSHYIDLAIVTDAQLIVSRDRHLLELIDQATVAGREFQSRFPAMRIITPDALLKEVEASRAT